jgi:hypothetical protein
MKTDDRNHPEASQSGEYEDENRKKRKTWQVRTCLLWFKLMTEVAKEPRRTIRNRLLKIIR